jgi:hypothetical protein
VDRGALAEPGRRYARDLPSRWPPGGIMHNSDPCWRRRSAARSGCTAVMVKVCKTWCRSCRRRVRHCGCCASCADAAPENATDGHRLPPQRVTIQPPPSSTYRRHSRRCSSRPTSKATRDRSSSRSLSSSVSAARRASRAAASCRSFSSMVDTVTSSFGEGDPRSRGGKNTDGGCPRYLIMGETAEDVWV